MRIIGADNAMVFEHGDQGPPPAVTLAAETDATWVWSESEAVAKVCTTSSIQVVDASGNPLESQGGVNGGEIVVVRVGDQWLLRDLTRVPSDDCPRPGGTP